MALEALASSSALPAFVVYDTISASSSLQNAHNFASSDYNGEVDYINDLDSMAAAIGGGFMQALDVANGEQAAAAADCVAGAGHVRRRRRKRQRRCKNKEEAESQRMTHIAVERNRRRLMNEHLAVLRSLMPESYIQRVSL